MQQLVGRLAALDPEAGESLKVITYFDALVDGRASIEVLLRGAAILSGCAAGYADGRERRRVAAAGGDATDAADRTDARDAAEATVATDPRGGHRWPEHPVGGGGLVWIERTGPEHANDELILERLAFGVAVAIDRSPLGSARRALETVVDLEATPDARRDAAQRMGLAPQALYRVVATPASAPVPASSTATEGGVGPLLVRNTAVGRVRLGLRLDGGAGEAPERGREASRCGVGLARTPDALPESWASALTALRLTTDHETVLLADDLGTLLLLAPGLDATPNDGQDLTALRTLVASHPRSLELLESVSEHDSLRAVAAELGLHHSTVQARVAECARSLGFDLRSARGRVRLSLALAHLRLASNRFE